jgi:hypothetical protein
MHTVAKRMYDPAPDQLTDEKWMAFARQTQSRKFITVALETS